MSKKIYSLLVFLIIGIITVFIVSSCSDKSPTSDIGEPDGGDGPKATETEVVDVTNPVTGKTWMDRNLGARRAATSMIDAQAYGDLYQWGRAEDGHQNRNSRTISALSSTDTPGHSDFILAPNSPFDWRNLQNDNLWQGGNGVNNPCPDGYRLPTESEWQAERESWSTDNVEGAFSSPLKLPLPGFRRYSSGLLVGVGVNGFYWSSMVSTGSRNFGGSLRFNSSDAGMLRSPRALGFSVRRLKD